MQQIHETMLEIFYRHYLYYIDDIDFVQIEKLKSGCEYFKRGGRRGRGDRTDDGIEFMLLFIEFEGIFVTNYENEYFHVSIQNLSFMGKSKKRCRDQKQNVMHIKITDLKTNHHKITP